MNTGNEQLPRLLVFIPSYNAERHIRSVLERIPNDLGNRFDVEILMVDDASKDDTVPIARSTLEELRLPYVHHILANPENRGYGGNQKLGYSFALDRGFDVVVMVHGDGQYPPEMVGPLANKALEYGVAFGSRFGWPGAARAGGMPRYKWIGNRLLTWFQNTMLHTELTEFHSGFRAYATRSLREIPFALNSDDFQFDTEIFIQLKRAGYRIAEISIPTHYGDEVCHVNGVAYARNVVLETVKGRLHDSGLFYELKFDVGSDLRYENKLEFDSPSSRAARMVPDGSRVLDLGSSEGYLAKELRSRGCLVTGVDIDKPAALGAFNEFRVHDLNQSLPKIGHKVEVILLLDVVEHLLNPERMVAELREFCESHGVDQVIVSTGNVGFIIPRLALLLGQFNYGRRGILDMTHTRLFTFRTIQRLFRQAGFVVEEVHGIPAPFPLAFGSGTVSRLLLAINRAFIRLLPKLFSYQVILQVRVPRSIDLLVEDSIVHGSVKSGIQQD